MCQKMIKTAIFKKNLPLGGRSEALRYTLMAIMMSNEFVFRLELGLGDRREQQSEPEGGEDVDHRAGVEVVKVAADGQDEQEDSEQQDEGDLHRPIGAIEDLHRPLIWLIQQ